MDQAVTEDAGAANNRQVGGQHYVSSYQHWDFVLDTGQDYLQGNATKYIARWRKKAGLEDLKKALHYVDKLVEVSGNGVRVLEIPRIKSVVTATKRFCDANGLTVEEHFLLLNLVTWNTLANLLFAQEFLRQMITDELARAKAKYPVVPLTEENHYADRT